MLTWLENLTEAASFLRIFGYLSVRSAFALTTSLVIAWFLYPSFIAWLQKVRAGQSIRSDGPESHQQKAGTPTMGGALMLFAIVVAGVLWARPEEPKVWAVLIIAVSFAAIGFVDDYKKVAKRDSAGLSGKIRLILEFGISGAVVFWLVYTGKIDTAVPVPFMKGLMLELSWGYIAFAAFVIVAFANAVNLTDGLDGLAIGPVMTSMVAMGILAYIAGHYGYATYLNIPYVAGSGELVILAVAVFGAGLGFLWFNTFPATVFMGDTGSLPLGGMLGVMAVVTRNELAVVILGGIFVMEAVSVVVQVASFKLTGKRVFKMAPFHHHLELIGWEEPKIIVRFWIISVVLAAMALLTLKMR